MILANIKQRLTAADIDLVVHLLAEGDAAHQRRLERLVAQDGPDALLDDPTLLEHLRRHPSLGSPSPALFLYVAVRETLRTVGIDDTRLAEYLGAMLYEFGLRDRALRVAHHSDHEYRYLTEIVADLDPGTGRRGFLIRAHLGNFSLWLAGVFPDFITTRRARKGGPDLSYYDTMGARGFRLASDHRLAREFELDDIYAKAADAFPTLRVALNRLSDRLFFPRCSSPDRLMRQVADEFNLSL